MNIKVVESTSTSSLDEIIAAIETYGADNVELLYGSDIVYTSFNHGFEDAQKYVKLVDIAGSKVLHTIFNAFIINRLNNDEYIVLLSNKLGVSSDDLMNKIMDIAIEKSVILEYLPENTSKEHLNSLAEKNLIRLFYVENVQSIDLDFVKKYSDDLDLGSILHHSNDPEVIKYLEEMKDEELL